MGSEKGTEKKKNIKKHQPTRVSFLISKFSYPMYPPYMSPGGGVFFVLFVCVCVCVFARSVVRLFVKFVNVLVCECACFV